MKLLKPHVAPTTHMKEFTLRGVLLGLLLGVIFAIGNTYLGLKVGLTVSASIPAAVISMALLRALTRTSTILENNLVQTIASAGEAVAAGVIFTVPALAILGEPLSVWRTLFIAIIGGLLGVLLLIPLRHTLMVEEHQTLPYPEGTACAEILKLREESGERALLSLWGLLIGAIDKICMGIFRIWPETASWGVLGTRISIDTTPALLGVGYIIGARTSLILVAGSALAWWVMIPLIRVFGADMALLDANQIWSETIRPIGTGTVAVAGLISLGRLIPLLIRSLRGHFSGLLRDLFHGHHKIRTERDLPLFWSLAGAILLLIAAYFLPGIQLNGLSLLFLLILAFFFVALTAIVVGMVGFSSSPVSGMVICTLLITGGLYLALGWTERAYLLMAMTLGAIASVAIAIAGDTSQDLKTGVLVGATPRWQQIGALLGVLLPGIAIAWSLILLQRTYGFGSDQLPAPQATMMAMVVKGVITGTLPYNLVGMGVILGIVVALLGVPALPFALGIYLPLSTTLAIGGGALLSWLVLKMRHGHKRLGRGILVGSGLIAGDALTGILMALLAITGLLNLDKSPLSNAWISLTAYLVLAALFALLVLKSRRSVS